MSFILNWIRNRNEKKNLCKQAAYDHINTFVEYLYQNECVKYSELFNNYKKWLNEDADYNFHEQYISTLTISLIAFLQTIRKFQLDRKEWIQTLLSNQLEMIIQDADNLLYDDPTRCHAFFNI